MARKLTIFLCAQRRRRSAFDEISIAKDDDGRFYQFRHRVRMIKCIIGDFDVIYTQQRDMSRTPALIPH